MPDDTHLSQISALPAVTAARHREIPRTPWRFIWHYASQGFIWQVLAMACLYGAATAAETIQAFVLGQLVNVLSGTRDGNPMVWFAALCGTWFSASAFANAYGAVYWTTQTKLRMRIHEGLFAYLMGHAPRYFLDHISGALAHKIRVAASSATTFLDLFAAHAVRFVILFGVAGVMLARTAPEMLWPAALFVVVLLAILPMLARPLRTLAKASSHAASEQSGRMGDSALNWELVRSFSGTAQERRALGPYNDREAATYTGLRFAAIRMRLILHGGSFAFLAWLAFHALQSTLAGEISVGTLTMLVTLYLLVGNHVRSLGDILFSYYESVGQLGDALSTILAPHDIVDPPHARTLGATGGAISIRNVDFDYPDGKPVFRNFSLEVAAGEKIGLVGTSGAGKSTLIKILRRQFPIKQGAVLIDGQDIAAATWDSVHDAFAEVPQNPGMFHRSVRDNIAYGRPDATDDEVIAAAKLAHCHAFIASRAKGYESIVGEKGMKLSGGERQRVAIARAFLKNAPVLLLDEATSSLDSEAEHLIQEALLDLMKGRTVIAIAHRLSTIMHLDRIVVLEDGRIVEQGNHAALLARGQAYARLWQRQAGGFM